MKNIFLISCLVDQVDAPKQFMINENRSCEKRRRL